MHLISVTSGDIPPAPTAPEWCSRTREDPGFVRNQFAVRPGVAGAEDESRHAAARQAVGVMAAQTTPELPLHDGVGARIL